MVRDKYLKAHCRTQRTQRGQGRNQRLKTIHHGGTKNTEKTVIYVKMLIKFQETRC